MNFFILIVCSALMTISSCSSHKTNQVPKDKMSAKGTIDFSAPSSEETSSQNFESKKIMDLTQQSNIWMTIKHPDPLANYLQELDPGLSIDDACSNGNYHFTFYVDGIKVYDEALNFGAGTTHTKQKQNGISVPLATTHNEDSWGRYLWMRFMLMGGGEDAMYEEGNHKLKIEARPYIEIDEHKFGEIIAEGAVTLNVIKPKLSDIQIKVQPIAPNSGWDVSQEKINEQLIEDLNRKIGERYFKDISGIVIIKNEKLLLEEYFNNAERSSLHNPRSVGKTFASAVMGMAIDEGYIKSVDEKLSRFYNLKSFNNFTPNKEEVTIKSLLMMSSGFDADDDDWDSPGNEENMYPTDDWVKFALDLPMDKQKTIGENWNYFTAGVVVLGDILHQNLPGGLDAYADQHLFKPLDIIDYKWQYTPTYVANTAGGIQLRAVDFAKFGQLYKNKGTWKGKQILPATWVEESLFPHASLPDGGNYGYLFWNHSYEVKGKSYEAYYCSGNGGNKIFIFKDIPVVIVITATAYGMPYAHPQVNKMMTEHILPAILD